jgi:hypothetical protein
MRRTIHILKITYLAEGALRGAESLPGSAAKPSICAAARPSARQASLGSSAVLWIGKKV